MTRSRARNVFTPMFFLQLALPVAVIIYLLVEGRSIQYAGSRAILVTLGVFFLLNWEHGLWEKIKIFIDILRRAGVSLAQMAVLAFVAQIVVSFIAATGVGVKFTQMMVAVGGADLFFVLVMGMPTTAAYVLSASLAAPALTALDVPRLDAHMFAFYFAIVATITPPVCTAIYAAAAIAGIRWTRAVKDTLRLGWVAFTIPFMFAYNPELLFRGEPLDIAVTFAFKAIGVVALAAATISWWSVGLSAVQRVLAFAGAFLLITAELALNFAGLAAVALALVLNLRAARAAAQAGET